MKVEIESLKKIVNEHEKTIVLLKRSLKEEVDSKEQETHLKCKTCKNGFKSRQELKAHIKDVHNQKIHCMECGKSFEKNCELEKHLNEHTKPKQFKCETCGKEFHKNWRMKKHQDSHGQNQRFCHFFNNGKVCPYEEIGCMFAHEVSPRCIF